MNKASMNKLAANVARTLFRTMELKQQDIVCHSIYASVIKKATEIVGKDYSGSARTFIYENKEEILRWCHVNKPKKVVTKKAPRVSKTIRIPKAKKQSLISSPEFLSSYEWRKTRMIALKRYGARCMCCGATPATGAVMNVDHIKPRKLYPSLALDVENLQILCGACNHGKGNWDMTDWRPA